MLFDRILKHMSNNGRRKSDKDDLGEKDALAAHQTVYDQSEELAASQEMFETRIHNLKTKMAGMTPGPNAEGESK